MSGIEVLPGAAGAERKRRRAVTGPDLRAPQRERRIGRRVLDRVRVAARDGLRVELDVLLVELDDRRVGLRRHPARVVRVRGRGRHLDRGLLELLLVELRLLLARRARRRSSVSRS